MQRARPEQAARRIAPFAELDRRHPTGQRLLSAIRTEWDREVWIVLFQEAVSEAAAQAECAIVAIASLLATDRRPLLASPKAGPASYRLFEMLPMVPRFSIERVRQRLGMSFPTATAADRVLEDLGIVTELTGSRKSRTFSYRDYVELLTR